VDSIINMIAIFSLISGQIIDFCTVDVAARSLDDYVLLPLSILLGHSI